MSSPTITTAASPLFISLLDLPPELFLTVFLYLDKTSLRSFILTNSQIFTYFELYRLKSLDQIRLEYLNLHLTIGENHGAESVDPLNQFGRLIELYDIPFRLRERLFSGNTETSEDEEDPTRANPLSELADPPVVESTVVGRRQRGCTAALPASITCVRDCVRTLESFRKVFFAEARSEVTQILLEELFRWNEKVALSKEKNPNYDTESDEDEEDDDVIMFEGEGGVDFDTNAAEKEGPTFVVAGGFMLRCLTGMQPRMEQQDIDVFVLENDVIRNRNRGRPRDGRGGFERRSDDGGGARIHEIVRRVLLKAHRRILRLRTERQREEEEEEEEEEECKDDSVDVDSSLIRDAKLLRYALVKNSSTLMVFSHPLKGPEPSPLTRRHRPPQERHMAEIPLQFVFRRVSCLEELLCFFDLDLARFAYDGKRVWTTHEGLRGLCLKMNIVQSRHNAKQLYFRRAMKYWNRGAETIFFDLHPLWNLYQMKEIRNRLLPSRDESSEYHNVRYDTDSQEFKVDVGLYTPFGHNVQYQEAKDIATIGVERFVQHDDDFECVWESNRFQMPLHLRGLKKALEREPHTFALGFDGLYAQDASIFFQEGYFDSHLFKKYDFLACYSCGKYCRVNFDQSLRSFLGGGEAEEEGTQRRTSRYQWYELTEDQIASLRHIRKEQRFCQRCARRNSRMRERILIRSRAIRDTPQGRFPILHGKVAIVTGARIKIGFATALVLLRAGCRVIATTRFPANARQRYEAVADYASFQSRLSILPLNLRNVENVGLFVESVKTLLGDGSGPGEEKMSVDILINNAATTVRHPVLYYRELIQAEVEDILKCVDHDEDGRKAISSGSVVEFSTALPAGFLSEFIRPDQLVSLSRDVTTSSRESEIRLRTLRDCFEGMHTEDLENISKQKKTYFPEGQRDEFGEPVDLRPRNSWHLAPPDIPSEELLETQVVNHLSPTTLIQKLFPLMKRRRREDAGARSGLSLAHIVNVTSAEGQFSSPRKDFVHVHTNCSKSAINMLTRTAAEFYARHGIMMVSVDTGWISSSVKTWVPPPLDLVDAACRILHPIFANSRRYGKLFKEYRIVDW